MIVDVSPCDDAVGRTSCRGYLGWIEGGESEFMADPPSTKGAQRSRPSLTYGGVLIGWVRKVQGQWHVSDDGESWSNASFGRSTRPQ